MSDYADQKTLEPTPHRREQARQQGHVAKSHDLGSAAMLLMALAVLVMLGGSLVGFLADYCRQQLGGQPWLTVDAEFVASQWHGVLSALGRRLLPILGLLCLAGVAVNIIQTGFLFLPQRLSPDPGRISLARGWQRIFSGAGLLQLGFGLFKLAMVGAVAGAVLYHERAAILRLAALPPPALLGEAGHIILSTGWKLAAGLLVLALLDYAYQRWRHERNLRMTPQELREELRNLEGNPQVVTRRKQVQRSRARRDIT